MTFVTGSLRGRQLTYVGVSGMMHRVLVFKSPSHVLGYCICGLPFHGILHKPVEPASVSNGSSAIQLLATERINASWMRGQQCRSKSGSLESELPQLTITVLILQLILVINVANTDRQTN